MTDNTKLKFYSPSSEMVKRRLDLNELLIKNPSATFFVRVEGDSTTEETIKNGDILIIDRSLTPTRNKIVVAIQNGEFVVNRLKHFINTEFEIWGVVTNIIHKCTS